MELQLEASQTQTQQVQAQQPPESFNWRRGKDLLFPITWVQSVFLGGKLYVSGEVGVDDDGYSIQVYTPENDGWSRLQCPVKLCALAVVNQQLVLVGGNDSSGTTQSMPSVWDSASQCWTTPYPDMKTARIRPGAIGYQKYLVVAGGYDPSFDTLNTVEILNTTTKQWIAASPLPHGSGYWSSAAVGDTLYLLGGDVAGKRMLSISLSALISHATSTSQAPPPKWDEAVTKLTCSTAVSLNNSLLAVGGTTDEHDISSAIHLYDPRTRQWSKVGDVPDEVRLCGCAVLSSGELVVVGGPKRYYEMYSEIMHIASVN